MNTELRTSILHAVTELQLLDQPTQNLINQLYGFFDECNYAREILDSGQLETVASESPRLAMEIRTICMQLQPYGK